ncbi:sulfotransferase [uncultured Roseobacter sp.]|uniref:sulfotransferase family protein n=1 Tax=uncultured Roseobacter sp. TaxID=114847 RepID=UPI002617F878|nr:sulfotransferase [uncultured Roseobacter sp.]
MNAGRKPDIVCIGAQKAGTSWFHETLATRSDIWVPPFKELHFFDHKFIEECRRWAPWHVKKGLKAARERHVSGVAPQDDAYLAYLERLATRPILNGTWYKYVFSRAGNDQKCLDVTPEYSCIPETGVDFFKRFLPDARLIFIVRNPLERLKSQLRMMAHRKNKAQLTDTEWTAILEMPALSTRGDYLQNIPRWDDRFSEDQLLYLPFGQIKKDPTGLLRTVESHCGLPPSEYKNADRRVHQTEPLHIPNFVLDHVERNVSLQNRFIEDRFGRTFFMNTT